MSAGQVDMVLDGLQALQYMDTHTKPDLILLDAPWDLQKIPEESGRLPSHARIWPLAKGIMQLKVSGERFTSPPSSGFSGIFRSLNLSFLLLLLLLEHWQCQQ